jgi:enoyl-CoA hydratase/carnithine racemase
MSLWRTPKPVIAQVHGWCVGGGSDMALCADLVIASEDAQIGTPYSRVWGCYLSDMWLYRLGLTKAKEHALTGGPLSGRQAADVELITTAVPFQKLEQEVQKQAEQLASLPMSQLAAMKLIVNQAYESMGLRATQTLGRSSTDSCETRQRPAPSSPMPPSVASKSRQPSATGRLVTTAWLAPTIGLTHIMSSRAADACRCG